MQSEKGRGGYQCCLGLPGEEGEEGGGGGDRYDREDDEDLDGGAGATGGERAGEGRVLVHGELVPRLAGAGRAGALLGPHRRRRRDLPA